MKEQRDLLSLLKFELCFLECGGYRRGARAHRPQRIFEDSPTCPNLNDPTKSTPCSDCILSRLAPREWRFLPAPCRHISLNEKGETVDSLDRYGSQPEVVQAVRNWLGATIKQLERMCGFDGAVKTART